jgi:DNA-binding MarR family transcriptional regulator
MPNVQDLNPGTPPFVDPAVPVDPAHDPMPDMATRLRIVVGKLSRRLGAPGAGSGFTPSQLSVLGTLTRQGPLRLSELAAVEGINPTMLSRIVGKLDDAGMITRRADDTDRRAAHVEITERGTAAFAAIRARRTAVLATGLAELSTDHAAALADALDALEALVAALARVDQVVVAQVPVVSEIPVAPEAR